MNWNLFHSGLEFWWFSDAVGESVSWISWSYTFGSLGFSVNVHNLLVYSDNLYVSSEGFLRSNSHHRISISQESWRIVASCRISADICSNNETILNFHYLESFKMLLSELSHPFLLKKRVTRIFCNSLIAPVMISVQ